MKYAFVLIFGLLGSGSVLAETCDERTWISSEQGLAHITQADVPYIWPESHKCMKVVYATYTVTQAKQLNVIQYFEAEGLLKDSLRLAYQSLVDQGIYCMEANFHRYPHGPSSEVGILFDVMCSAPTVEALERLNLNDLILSTQAQLPYLIETRHHEVP